VRTDAVERWLARLAPARAFGQYRRLKYARLTLDEIIRPPREQFLVVDPSEAVRSGEIVGILSRHFDVCRTIPMGGTLVQPLFTRTAANFWDDPEGAEWVAKILAHERDLVRPGRLASDFVAILARPYPVPRSPRR
jgi:hypothetical protein